MPPDRVTICADLRVGRMPVATITAAAAAAFSCRSRCCAVVLALLVGIFSAILHRAVHFDHFAILGLFDLALSLNCHCVFMWLNKMVRRQYLPLLCCMELRGLMHHAA